MATYGEQLTVGEEEEPKKMIALCQNCKREYDVTYWNAALKNVHCDCGGYIINPAGHMKLRKVKEDKR